MSQPDAVIVRVPFERASIVPESLIAEAGVLARPGTSTDCCVPGQNRRCKSGRLASSRALPSPSRHIYNPLTIAVAFRRLLAFDRVWQHLIKVDGTFA